VKRSRRWNLIASYEATSERPLLRSLTRFSFVRLFVSGMKAPSLTILSSFSSSVGSDVMEDSHEPRGVFMSSGQTTVFEYPTLSEKAYNPNKLTLNPSVDTLIGGGRLTLTVGGALEGEVSLVSSDESILLTETEEGIWAAELPNESAEYTFTVTFEGEGVYHGITASCRVRTERHTHAFGAWSEDDDEQHRAACSCGETKYEAHAWGDWSVTKAATATVAGSRERACVCGKTQTEVIAPTGETDGNTAPGGSQSQTPTGGADGPTSIVQKPSFGCFSAVSGASVVLCAILGALTLRRRRT